MLLDVYHPAFTTYKRFWFYRIITGLDNLRLGCFWAFLGRNREGFVAGLIIFCFLRLGLRFFLFF